ncbi:hypothetical protein FDENT_1351 [Fusarium denticulatum]|uniref:Uncharacterized protein n=1 Tax=Fusarium denticulatum TaxID=48507 RepID=A0A8H6CVV7_9HYPO|nr:hypothetical protein FDENT_1351 [Fusarium denticulatum]
MHIARQSDLRIRHGGSPNDTGRTVFRPLETTSREASAVKPRMLECSHVKSLRKDNIKALGQLRWRFCRLPTAEYNATQRHNINGKRLAEKEGGPSTIDDLFKQTCLEMEAEKADAGEDADSESPNHILACRSLAIAASGSILEVVVTYKLSPRYPFQVIKQERGFDYSCTPKRTRSTASLNDAARILAAPPPPLRGRSSLRTSLRDVQIRIPEAGTPPGQGQTQPGESPGPSGPCWLFVLETPNV